MSLDLDKGVIEVEVGQTTPKDIWDEKDTWADIAAAGRKEWDQLTDARREAILSLTKKAIERMHDKMEEWVPDTLEVDGGNFVTCKFIILFTEIDKEIEEAEAATSFEIREAEAATVEMVKELEDLDN